MAMPMIKTLQQEIYLSFGKSSIVVKVVAVAVTIGYFLSFAKSIVPYLAVTPGYVLPPNFWVWTFVTHSFIEFHFWEVLADIAVLILCGKLLEPLWGALDMLIFLAVVNTGVALASSFLYIGIYLVTKNEEYLFETYIHGMVGYVAGFSVAVKQVMPDHKLLSSPFGTLRNTHIPLLLMFITITLRLINVVDGPYPFMFGFGILISWTYLRFYQKHSNGNRGDMADQFSFSSFFPSQLQPIIAIVSNTVFLALVKIKVCKKPQRKYDISSTSNATITITLPGTDPNDAERRKNVALKLLNERLNKTDQPSNWPSMDEEEQASPVSTTKSEDAPPPKSSSVKLPIPDFKENHQEKESPPES
ncbi:transmembrane protein 115-like [Ostrea edulis]|uniref:transmembrane protein 115-like n=1 Tax=Ostrea edulis TaxID=37623 RepID=UPI00209497BC|nr:transmembrane protein 115-like [Ostrea edulis]